MMKKLISLAMTLAMLCCMATTAFAATDNVVGYYGQNRDVTDGVNPFVVNSGKGNYELAIKVSTGDLQHRYAVDITYDTMELSITGGNLVWNVYTLEYDADTDKTAFANTAFNVSVTNYSDMPVAFTHAVTDEIDDGIDVAVIKDGDLQAYVDGTNDAIDATIRLESATSVTPYQAQTAYFDVAVKSDDWTEVANYYLPMLDNADDTETVATVTLTFTAPNA